MEQKLLIIFRAMLIFRQPWTSMQRLRRKRNRKYLETYKARYFSSNEDVSFRQTQQDMQIRVVELEMLFIQKKCVLYNRFDGVGA